MAYRFTIVGIGEALFDLFPDRQVLGGATLNAAVHAHQIAQTLGGRGVVVSRIGQDDLGRTLLADLTSRGLSTDYIQTDPDRATGKVYVTLDDPSHPSYEIVTNAAWDVMQFDPDLETLAAGCEAVIFGSLGQRDAMSRSTIQRFLTSARRAVRVFDVNLRQNFFTRSTLQRSCELCTVIKLNDQELPVVADLLAIPRPADKNLSSDELANRQAAALLKRFNLKLVALTRGPRGTVLFTPTARLEDQPVSYPSVPGADAVGAGDACSAGLLLGLVLRWPLERTLKLANHMGAYVASQPGATPAMPQAILDMAKA